MRASRLLSILMLLQTRGRMSAPALAAQLEVAPRTILRDMDQLSAAGVPVWSDRGRDGGFQLREGWSTDLTGLTLDEAQALLLAGLPAAATELGLGSASASARLKMLTAVPSALRENALRVGSRLHMDPVDWYRAAKPPAHLQAVAHAVWHQRVVSVRYESWQATKDRVLKPLGLVLKAGVWYLVALPDTGTEPRTYRVSNIQSLSVLTGSFRTPRGFNLAGFWQASTARFEAEIYRGTATLRVTRTGMQRLCALSAAVSEAAQASAQPDLNETTSLPTESPHASWLQVQVPIETVDHAAHQLLSVGADLEVIAPPALRERMRALLQDAAGLYASAL